MLHNELPPNLHLLGNSAYALSTYVLTPYRDNGHLNAVEKQFNKCHSSTRVDIERAFGLLKCKFRRLKYLDMYLLTEIPTVIVAACVLHNIRLIYEDIDEDLDGLVYDNNDGDNNDYYLENNNQEAARAKRQEIANLLL
uniref:Nuclease HARBI1-like n=1 Tax=Saccoglossus kowalevskii TaxID=10224 RepID=A0ABM0LY47_SACKO|nr:PREDICTED: putative nuclease HARBI1-like [Saccoglossus kowalevskii]